MLIHVKRHSTTKHCGQSPMFLLVHPMYCKQNYCFSEYTGSHMLSLVSPCCTPGSTGLVYGAPGPPKHIT